jgi:cytochrome c peroxidase
MQELPYLTVFLIVLSSTAAAAEEVTWDVTKQDRKAWMQIAPPTPNPEEALKVSLGKKLFFDKILSADRSMNCASCHRPEVAFSDPNPLSKGVKGELGVRHSPSILNLSVGNAYFWDGRAKSLEDQALNPIVNPLEMNLPAEEAIQRLRNDEPYVKMFNDAFHESPTAAHLAEAVAAYVRQLYSHASPFDKWVSGDEKALSAEAKSGFLLFVGKANCAKCHLGPNFTDGKYHNLGIGMDKPGPDLGRFLISKRPGDKGAFKTPGLREIAASAPHFHDGSASSLEEVIELYDKGGKPNGWLSPLIFELKLNPVEKKQLVEFLKALSGTINQP